jgi:hypothetical protein
MNSYPPPLFVHYAQLLYHFIWHYHIQSERPRGKIKIISFVHFMHQ